MIIKAALRAAETRAPSRRPGARRGRDIDEEVARLNRLVNDVLDFARPIRFDLAPVDVNALCQDAARAAARPKGRRSR